MGKRCLDYIKELNDYIDGELDSAICAEIEKHIGECNNCRIMVDTLKQTVRLCREGKPENLPAVLESRLNNLLKARWNKKFSQS